MAGVKLKRPRVVLCPTPEQMARWQPWADHFRKPNLSKFIPWLMDFAVRYMRQWERNQRTDLDKVGLQLGQRERLRKIVEDARDALDKLAESLR